MQAYPAEKAGQHWPSFRRRGQLGCNWAFLVSKILGRKDRREETWLSKDNQSPQQKLGQICCCCEGDAFHALACKLRKHATIRPWKLKKKNTLVLAPALSSLFSVLIRSRNFLARESSNSVNLQKFVKARIADYLLNECWSFGAVWQLN